MSLALHKGLCYGTRDFPTLEKLSAYEQYMPLRALQSPFVAPFLLAFNDARMKFDVRFYLVSLLFIVFDLEVAFLFPWASPSRKPAPSASGR